MLAGWILNIFQIAKMASVFTPYFVLKIVGIFIFPLGTILGWLQFFS
jgi:hypothetical protein